MNYLVKHETGEIIAFESAEISTSVDNFVITANFNLPDLSSLLTIKPAKNLKAGFVPIRYILGDEVYNLIIEDAEANEDSNSYRVSGRSVTVLLAEPYAHQITHTWHNITAFDLVLGLCADHGITLVWQVTDWALTEYIADQRYPIDIINDLVEDVGARALSLPSGELLIAKYPLCSPNKLHEQTPGYRLSTAINIFSASYQFVNHANYNRIVVTAENNGNIANAVNVSIEETKDGLDSVVKVFTNPIVERVNLTHASGENVAVFYEGLKEVIQTDELIFTEGNAQLSKPFSSLINTVWHQDILGELQIDRRGNVMTTQGLGLATIKYMSHYHQYRVQNLTSIDKTLIAIADIPTPTDLNALSAELVIGAGDNVAPAVVVKTLSNQLALIERGQSELWKQLFDVDEYTLDCAYEGYAMQCAKVASVQLTKQNLQFNGIVKSVSIKIDNTITQTITLDRAIL